jgi:hypothetical protein
MLTRTGLVIFALALAGCGVRGAIPENADHPLLWFVGLSLGICLLSGAAWLASGVARRWERRADRHD